MESDSRLRLPAGASGVIRTLNQRFTGPSRYHCATEANLARAVRVEHTLYGFGDRRITIYATPA